MVSDHALSAVTLLALLATCTPRSPFIGTVVECGSVEVIVASLRAFIEDPASVSAICGALAKVSSRPEGALAVASRGGSRQLSRMLQVCVCVVRVRG